MSIIYQPELIFNVREALGGALKAAGLRAAADFVAGVNKPWSYYLGMTFGGAALATTIPGAAATLYVIGDSLDFWVFKSPSGSELRMFLNGIQETSLNTYAVTEAWELIQNIVLAPGQTNELTFVNYAASVDDGATGIPFLALGDFEVFGTDALAFAGGSPIMDTIVFRLADSETIPKQAPFPVSIPSGQTIATIQAYATIAAKRLDLVTGSKIAKAEVTLDLTLPAYDPDPDSTQIKDAAVAGALNERGGLVSFDATGPRNESVWVPAIRTTIMPGAEFSLADADVASLVSMFTGNVTANSVAIRPVTPNNYQFSTALKGKKSLRRKS